MEISLKELLSTPKLSEKVRIDRPLVLFGYSSAAADIFKYEQKVDRSREAPAQVTSLMLDVSVQPAPLPAERIELKHVPGWEKTSFLNHATNWLLELQKMPQLQRRFIKLFGANEAGKSVFLPRFLNPVEPPPAYKGNLAKVARFVSLIPRKSAASFLEFIPEVYLTVDQALDVKACQSHAFLLCNYFNFLDREASRRVESYVALGMSWPRGKTAFVLRLDLATGNF